MRLKQLVPASVKPALVNVANRVELLTRRGVDEMIPPRRLAESIGAGDFEQTGQEFLRHFIELGHLRPSETVLDVGCGCGRMAVPLTYFSEVSRVLKDKGRCLATFFLLNEESLTLISEGSAAMNFRYGIDGCRVNDPEYPEAAIAYPKKFIRQLFESFSTEIRYGSWCGRKEFLSFQDIIIASSV